MEGLTAPLDGPVFEIARPVLERLPHHARRGPGASDTAQWAEAIDRARPALLKAGFPPGEIPFLKRMPADPEGLIAEILADLTRKGWLSEAGIRQPARRPPLFDHGGRTTFIYPEEGALLACLTAALRPRRTVFLGSYYGYWASFAVPEIVACDGQAVLVDPDPAVAAIARSNFGALPAVEVVCDTAESYLSTCTGAFDLVVLDAELPRDHPNPALRGKGLYHRLLLDVMPHLKAGAMLVAHNILFEDRTGDPFFDAVIARNRAELGPFMTLARDAFDFVAYGTTEGVGIGRLCLTPPLP